jgi:hypothetical protein
LTQTFIFHIILPFGIQEAHPESNKRVPAIVDALEKLELSPKVYQQYYFKYSQLFLELDLKENTFIVSVYLYLKPC